MNFKELQLPSNKKFGRFFSTVFLLLTIYFYFVGYITFLVVSISLFLLTVIITLTKPSLLSPFNRFWMLIGFIIGRVVSPIVLGIIFFLVFSPIAIIMRLFGRDELNLKSKNADTFWKIRSDKIKQESYKNQY